MLQIKNISKQYKTGDLVQVALDNVNLTFRDNEFVSILGPSGSGKTTLLNIIGGLDRYDKGDLIINNVSTKKYKDRDWDSYRNHTIGFVFQSYNLIPHQTVLANVELALTISGISKKERKIKALKALEKVGLKEQAHKKPTQMSGGQMQRVAIARALVNDPDILLADEPTGALDTHTSVQVMELLKEVAKDRLVIMVTHNPELAEQYSTRIVNLRDGKVQGDTNPFNVDKEKLGKAKHKNLGKSYMSKITAFSLSLNNLLTKKGRTILTSFAGSIGIIGIALILSLSTGFQNYVDKIQEDTLTSYPLTVNSETGDVASMLLSMAGKAEEDESDDEKNTVKERQNIASMFASLGKNDLKSFKKHMGNNQKKVDELTSLVSYQYSVSPNIYTKNVDNELSLLNPNNFFASIMGGGSTTTSLFSNRMSIFTEMVDNKDMVEQQYEIINGTFPKEYDEVMLVLPNENEVSDLFLYGIGLKNIKELENMIGTIVDGKKVENTSEPLSFTYDDLMNLELKLVDVSKTYRYNSKFDIYEKMTDDLEYMEDVYSNATRLKVVGIVKPKGETAGLSSGVVYTKKLTEHVIKTASESEIVKKQLANKRINVFSGKDFEDKDKKAGINFQDLVKIDESVLKSAFGNNINQKDIENMTSGYMTEISGAITADTTAAQALYLENLSVITKNILNDYISENQVGGVGFVKLSDVDSIVTNGIEADKNQTILVNMERQYTIPKSNLSQMYNATITAFLKQYITLVAGNMGGNGNTALGDDSEPKDLTAPIPANAVDTMVDGLVKQDMIVTSSKEIAVAMTEATMQKTILTKVGELTQRLMGTMSSAFKVDTSKFAQAFKFDMNEDEMKRLFTAMSSTSVENADTNLILLGYQNLEEPTSIAFYFPNFTSKEKFIDFIGDYNTKMENEDKDKVIKYSDITGILISSVKTIVDSVSYVLIAFVSISLIVSSIMIGIITYISVLERTKEIGILRAIGASKKNISSIFNAETFIVGLFSGILGIGVTVLFLIPVNLIIRSVNADIAATLPVTGAIVLIVLSIILTLIGGLIPSKAAAKKDPVLALRSE